MVVVDEEDEEVDAAVKVDDDAFVGETSSSSSISFNEVTKSFCQIDSMGKSA